MKFGVVIFPGSNCDKDIILAIKNTIGKEVVELWHKDTDLKNCDVIFLPGGFSYGDYLRSGAIAKFSPIMNAIVAASKAGKSIIGICNGFQILIEAGLLPGALINNNGVKFKSKQVSLRAENIDTIFTNKIPKDKKMFMPIAHRQGNYLADKETLEQISDNGQIAFTYTSDAGGNPNGSCLNIAGIFNKNKNILGMMPHPERASDMLLGSNDGALIFHSMMEHTN